MHNALLCPVWENRYGLLEELLRRTADSVLMPFETQRPSALSQAFPNRILSLESLLEKAEFEEIRREAVDRLKALGAVLQSEAGLSDLGALPRALLEEMVLLKALHRARDAFRIRLLLLSEEYTHQPRTLLAWAKANGVPSLHLAHAIALRRPYTVHQGLLADEHIAASAMHSHALAAKAAREGGAGDAVPGERAAVTVLPHPLFFRQLRLSRDRAALRRRFEEEQGGRPGPLVFFGVTFNASLTAQVDPLLAETSFRTMLAALPPLRRRFPALRLIVKLRPTVEAGEQARLRAIAAAWSQESGVGEEALLWLDSGTPSLVVLCDAVVSVASNLSFEALASGTPALNLFAAQDWEMGPPFPADLGILDVTGAELAPALERLLGEPAYRDRVLEAQKKGLLHYLLPADPSGWSLAPEEGEEWRRILKPLDAPGLHFQAEEAEAWEKKAVAALADRCLRRARPEKEAVKEARYFNAVNEKLLALIPFSARRVLEIGCAAGAFGEAVKRRFPGCYYEGLERDPEAARLAASLLDRVHEGDAEAFDFALLPAEGFDAIVLGDILEHLREPGELLRKLRNHLKPGGSLLVCIPNASHWSVLAGLFLGKWEYADAGILDRTHLRFFTRPSFTRLLTEKGFAVREVEGYRTSIALTPSFKNFLKTLRIEPERFDAYANTCQWVFRAEQATAEAAAAEKPGADLGYYQVWNQKLFEMLPPALGSVLELGCASGHLGEAYRRENPACHYAGIELVPEAARLAKARLSEVHIGDLEDFDWTRLRGRKFEAAVFGDVLEHLRDPEKLLREVLARLAPGGLLIVCLPNICNWTIIEGLLRDEWEYADSGLLDRTHLRFFTRSGFLEILSRLGYRVEAEASHDTGVPLTVEIGAFLQSAGVGLRDFHDRSRVFQFLLRARPLAVPSSVSAPTPSVSVSVLAEVPVLATVPVPAATVIIPVFNKVDLTRGCLESLEETRDPEFPLQVVVVDNASTDGTAAYLEKAARLYPWLEIRTHAENQGFARACNAGAERARGPYLIFLNNDTVVQPGWAEALLRPFFRKEGFEGGGPGGATAPQKAPVGMTGARLLFPDWTVQHAGVVLDVKAIPTHIHRDLPSFHPDVNVPREYPAVTGACMALPAAVFGEVGGFDTGYRMYYEDIDLCFAVRRAGYRILYVPESTVFHLEGQSSPDTARVLELNNESRPRFIERWRTEILHGLNHETAFFTGGRKAS